MKPQTFSYESMGTRWSITIWDSIREEKLVVLKEEIQKRSKEFDETYSRFIKTSLIWNIAQKPGVYEMPKEGIEMLEWYFKLYEPSEKKLNPLIGHTISDLGYDADYTLIPKQQIRTTPDLISTLKIIDNSHIETKEAVLIDVGALGKGYFVDVIARFLKENNIQHFLVDGSGDIYYEGKGNILRVGLEHPDDPQKVIGVVPLSQGAMCGSGTNRRKWGNYHHVINPLTNTSAEGIIATWAIAASAVLADGLASCLFFVQPEKLAAFTFEYCILYNDYTVKRSPGFLGEMF